MSFSVQSLFCYQHLWSSFFFQVLLPTGLRSKHCSYFPKFLPKCACSNLQSTFPAPVQILSLTLNLSAMINFIWVPLNPLLVSPTVSPIPLLLFHLNSLPHVQDQLHSSIMFHPENITHRGSIFFFCQIASLIFMTQSILLHWDGLSIPGNNLNWKMFQNLQLYSEHKVTSWSPNEWILNPLPKMA